MERVILLKALRNITQTMSNVCFILLKRLSKFQVSKITHLFE